MTVRNGFIIAGAVLAVASAILLEQRRSLRADEVTLTAAIAAADSIAIDARLRADVNRVLVQLERSRVRSTPQTEPHLAISLTDSLLTLERGDIVLRTARIVAAVPRGVHAVLEVGPKGILLADSIRIVPDAGGLDTTSVPAGTVRLRRADYNAVLPNVRPGLIAYLY